MIAGLTNNTSIVWLNVDIFDSAVLDSDGVSLTAVLAEDLGTVEFGVQGSSKGTRWVGEETDVAGFVGVKGFTPCFHAGKMDVSKSQTSDDLVKRWNHQRYARTVADEDMTIRGLLVMRRMVLAAAKHAWS